jgi:VanZ family protein
MPYTDTKSQIDVSRRAKRLWTRTFRVLLIAYWTALFLATHLPVPKMIAKEVSDFDKIIHATAFFILAGLLVLWDGWPYRLTPQRLLLFAILIVGYAALDEWLQTKVGRFGDTQDWISDVVGGFCALGLACLLQRRLYRHRNRRGD